MKTNKRFSEIELNDFKESICTVLPIYNDNLIDSIHYLYLLVCNYIKEQKESNIEESVIIEDCRNILESIDNYYCNINIDFYLTLIRCIYFSRDMSIIEKDNILSSCNNLLDDNISVQQKIDFYGSYLENQLTKEEKNFSLIENLSSIIKELTSIRNENIRSNIITI